MNMLKKASYLGFFVAVVLLGDRLVAVLAKNIIRHSQNQFVRMYEGKERADIVFLGDSRVDRDFDFQKIAARSGRSCLNLGLGGNSALVSEILLKDYVSRYGNPGLVILEMSQTTTSPDRMGEMRIFSYCSPGMAELARALDPTHARFASVFFSLKFNDPVFWRLAAEVFGKSESRLLKRTIPQVLKQKWSRGKSLKMPIYKKNMEAIQRICAFAESKTIRIKLLINPNWGEYRKSISNYSDWIEALQNATAPNVILDYGDVFGAQPEFFNDEIHLNEAGATRYLDILLADSVFEFSP